MHCWRHYRIPGTYSFVHRDSAIYKPLEIRDIVNTMVARRLKEDDINIYKLIVDGDCVSVNEWIELHGKTY
jgi:hypothetical protein